MKYLLEAAAGYDVTVKFARLRNDEWGFFVPSKRVILIDKSLTLAQMRTTLAHELGHLHYGHDCTNETTERQAWTRASLILIDPDDYIEAEVTNPHPNAIAKHLVVLPRVVITWQEQWLPRLLATPVYGAKHRAAHNMEHSYA